MSIKFLNKTNEALAKYERIFDNGTQKKTNIFYYWQIVVYFVENIFFIQRISWLLETFLSTKKKLNLPKRAIKADKVLLKST